MSDALEEDDGKVSGGNNITSLRFADAKDALAKEAQFLRVFLPTLSLANGMDASHKAELNIRRVLH